MLRNILFKASRLNTSSFHSNSLKKFFNLTKYSLIASQNLTLQPKYFFSSEAEKDEAL